MLSALLAVCSLLTTAGMAQWSQPELVVSDTFPPLTGQRLIAGQGDTIWVLYLRGELHTDTCEIRAQWSTGGPWSAPEVVVRSWLLSGLWLGWYNGDFPIDAPPETTWGIWTCYRESGRWSVPELAIRTMEGIPTGCSFGTDRDGNWLMGIEQQTGSLTEMHYSALYSRLEGDTWTWPRYIAQGNGSPDNADHLLPSLAPHPEGGFWAAHESLAAGSPPVVKMDQVVNDTVYESAMYEPVSQFDATSGPQQVLMLALYDQISVVCAYVWPGRLVLDEIAYDVIAGDVTTQICYDSMGCTWVGWVRSDTTPVVSYYDQEDWWSEPEPVTESTGILLDLTTDTQGRIYAMFCTSPQTWYTTYRLERPGVEEMENGEVRTEKAAATVVRGVLVMPAAPLSTHYSLLSTDGRKVADLVPGVNDVRRLSPGIYFVRPAASVEREASSVTKVVVTR
jgi:hypothetical protein